MNWQPVKTFIAQAFSENGSPSSSRIIAGWLSVSSMSCIWFCVRHMMLITDPAKLQTWAGMLPNVIYALGVFTTMPYGVGKAGQAIMEFAKNRQDKDPDSSSQAPPANS